MACDRSRTTIPRIRCNRIPLRHTESVDARSARDHPGIRRSRTRRLRDQLFGEQVPTRWTRATVYDDMWVDPADDPREDASAVVDERTLLLE